MNDGILVRNPATGAVLATVPKSTSEEILHVAQSSVEAFKSWSQTSRRERQDKLHILASLIHLHEAEIVSRYHIKSASGLSSPIGHLYNSRNWEDEFRCTFRSPSWYRHDTNCSRTGLSSWRASRDECSHANLHIPISPRCLRSHHPFQSSVPGTTMASPPTALCIPRLMN